MRRRKIDPYSFNCGVIESFCEVVAAGVKPLAISHPFATPEERDSYLPFVREMQKKYGIVFLPEDDLLVTDLFPVEACRGVSVFLLAGRQSMLEQYQELRDQKAWQLRRENYKGNSRKKIAKDFGRLLGYSTEAIAQKLAENHTRE